jgi:hypothetical protein
LEALLLIVKLVGVGALFVVTVGLVDRLIGARYGRRAKLPLRVVEVLSVVMAIAVTFLIAFICLRWF